jgi:hypothetical protein
MNGYAGVGEYFFKLIFKAIAYLVDFFEYGAFWHYQMQVDKAPAARLAGSQLMKADQAFAMTADTGCDTRLLLLGQTGIDQPAKSLS